MLYEELGKRNIKHWGGTESNPYGLGDKKIEPYEYLRRHYDYGATVVVMNSGASGALDDKLYEGLWNKESVFAYYRFLSGK